MKHLILMLSALVAVSAGHAQVAVHEKSPETKYAFTLASPRQTAAILYDASDAAVVKRAAELFAADVEAVTGRRPQVTSATGETGPAVIVGTVGGSALIRRLSEAGKIDTAPLEGAWERYLIQTVANPLPGIRKALVIAGSDRRGAAYGLFTLSELIGVSPWYWWADVPVKKHAALHVDAPPTYSQTPSVRYRGIFLNDEDCPGPRRPSSPSAATSAPEPTPRSANCCCASRPTTSPRPCTPFPPRSTKSPKTSSWPTRSPS